MDAEDTAGIATAFAAMGSEPRWAVLQALVRAGEAGLTVGEVGQRTGMPPSTLNHHLRSLVDGGLVRQVREGRAIRSVAAFDQLRSLAELILEHCCADAAGGPDV